MIGLTQTETPRRVLALFREAQRIMRHVPTKDDRGAWVTCHAIARAVRKLLARGKRHARTITVADGYFMHLGWEHSWIEVVTVKTDLKPKDRRATYYIYNGKRTRLREPFVPTTWIMDLYPIAQVGGPMLLSARGRYTDSPWSSAYMRRPIKRVGTAHITRQTAWLLKHLSAGATLR